MARSVLALVSAVALLAVLPVVDWSAPWSVSCQLRAPDGQVVFSGGSDEAVSLLAEPGGDVLDAVRAGPALTCRVPPAAPSGAAKDARLGLTPTAARLRSEVRAQFGRVPDGGFGPEPTLPGRSPDGAHSRGRAIDFFFRPFDRPASVESGWELANWAVANAHRLGVRTVIYRDRVWTARRSGQGWRDYRFRGPDPDNPINRHLDHVHVDVA
jgi:hypothetical protein